MKNRKIIAAIGAATLLFSTLAAAPAFAEDDAVSPEPQETTLLAEQPTVSPEPQETTLLAKQPTVSETLTEAALVEEVAAKRAPLDEAEAPETASNVPPKDAQTLTAVSKTGDGVYVYDRLNAEIPVGWSNSGKQTYVGSSKEAISKEQACEYDGIQIDTVQFTAEWIWPSTLQYPDSTLSDSAGYVSHTATHEPMNPEELGFTCGETEEPAPVEVVTTTIGEYDCTSTTVSETTVTTNVGHKLVDNEWVLDSQPNDHNKSEKIIRDLTDKEVATLDCPVVTASIPAADKLAWTGETSNAGALWGALALLIAGAGLLIARKFATK
jgi:hypothetical protein